MYELRQDIKELEKTNLKSYNIDFIKNPTLLILQYLSDNEIEVNITDVNTKNFYEKFKKGNITTAHGFMKKYPIASYNGMIHFDDQTFEDDLKSKPIFNDLYNFFKGKEIENISILFHIINEMDRNVRNHSGYVDINKKEYYFSIQYYPRSNEIVFTILDDGVGIKKNLNFSFERAKENGEIPKSTTIATYACMNGITSGSNHKEVGPNGKNSGYGLFMLKKMGEFEENTMKLVADNKVYRVKKSTNGKTLQSETPIQNEVLKKITFVTAKLSLENLDIQLAEVEKHATGMSGKSKVIPLTNEELHEIFK